MGSATLVGPGGRALVGSTGYRIQVQMNRSWEVCGHARSCPKRSLCGRPPFGGRIAAQFDDRCRHHLGDREMGARPSSWSISSRTRQMPVQRNPVRVRALRRWCCRPASVVAGEALVALWDLIHGGLGLSYRWRLAGCSELATGLAGAQSSLSAGRAAEEAAVPRWNSSDQAVLHCGGLGSGHLAALWVPRMKMGPKGLGQGNTGVWRRSFEGAPRDKAAAPALGPTATSQDVPGTWALSLQVTMWCGPPLKSTSAAPASDAQNQHVSYLGVPTSPEFSLSSHLIARPVRAGAASESESTAP